MEGRNQVFQQLKPQCVALSQAALALNGPRGSIQAVTGHLEDLHKTLSKITAKPNSLDAKLADYVFFPLSQVLKLSQKMSLRCLELSLQCIAILVDQGWRQSIQPQLAAQVVILCTLMAEKKPKGFAFGETTDELQAAAFLSLYYIFAAAGKSAECKAFFASESNFPQLGQTISVIMKGIGDSDSAETQTVAANTLRGLVESVAHKEICASFLPGIVSKLTKILTPSTKQRCNHRVLIACLSTLSMLLSTTLSDDLTPTTRTPPSKISSSIIDETWKETAATQLKSALSSIMRLKTHSRGDVREALASLCLMLLEHCRKSLASCSTLALETLLTLSPDQHYEGDQHDVRLELLVKTDPSLAVLLQNTMYDWLQSLPTIMQSADEQKKVGILHQTSAAYRLLVESSADTGVIDRRLASSLRDSVVITLRVPGLKREASSLVSPVHSFDLAVLNETKGSTEFSAPLVKYRGQEEIMNGVERFTELITRSASSPTFATDLARSLRLSQGEMRIANFWLLLTATQTALSRKDNLSDFLDFDADDDNTGYHEYLEELYSFALSILADSSNESPDTRLQALALRTLALRAQTAGSEFRYDLIDALYPVLHTLATPDEQLQKDSITTLNVFTAACEYGSVKDLIVNNVDYLTNAVALKLNAFDVSPQAPQVLLMMVRLAGPSLLPYLEDTVESIFAALEDYHGYPLLVEMLFRVLGVMAEEGVKAPQLAITERRSAASIGILKERWQPMSINDLAEMLRQRAVNEAEAHNELRHQHKSHPQRPWKEVDDADSDKNESQDEDELGESSDQEQPVDDSEPPPPAPKTYNLLFKITELTQHFLPSASPSLRTSLLALIRTTVPAIARHENSFLPLVNTLWPEIISRLDDAELHVQATALDIIVVLCEHAGDFMRGRIVQLWPGIVEIYQKTIGDILSASGHTKAPPTRQNQTGTVLTLASGPSLKQASMRIQASPADYSNTSTRLIWDALVKALAAIVRSVQLPPELFDEGLEMLEPVLEQRHDVREALEEQNADAVWLARVKVRGVGGMKLPVVPQSAVWQFALVPG